MAYMISDECMACGICNAARVCPNGAITEGDMISVVDPSRCTECVGANPAPVCIPDCPAQAIVLDTSHRESEQELLAKWRSLHPGETPKFFSAV
jgi:Fe-S-cluster-containing hydrogenase component 2